MFLVLSTIDKSDESWFRVQFLTLFEPLGEYFCFPCVLYVFNYCFKAGST